MYLHIAIHTPDPRYPTRTHTVHRFRELVNGSSGTVMVHFQVEVEYVVRRGEPLHHFVLDDHQILRFETYLML